MKRAALAVLVVARVASADAEADAERTFRDAVARGDIATLEQLGAATPATRWTDDAWVEAARIAVRGNDFDRARADLDRAIAVGTDEQLVRRAKAERDRLAGFTGAGGEWNAVAAAHERLAPALSSPGDPKPALGELEKLVRDNPRYPRAPMLMVAIAQAWEREGEGARAIEWLRRAVQAAVVPGEHQRARIELVHALIRAGALDAAAAEIATLDASPIMRGKLQHELASAQRRRAIRWAMWGVLAVLVAAAAFALRRTAGSLRAALGRLVRPPGEVLFLVPIGGVLVALALTGNPLVARTVIAIVGGGIATSWLSGAILAGTKPRLRVALVHAALAVLAIGAICYLAIDRGRLIDLLIETWQSGPER